MLNDEMLKQMQKEEAEEGARRSVRNERSTSPRADDYWHRNY